jgi:hypothetical protein
MPGVRRGSVLSDARICLALQRPELALTDLYGAILKEASFREANLQGASFYSADLRKADLVETDLRSTFYEWSYDVHRGLTDMCVSDERFRSNYDTLAPGPVHPGCGPPEPFAASACGRGWRVSTSTS